jgi:phospholipase C
MTNRKRYRRPVALAACVALAIGVPAATASAAPPAAAAHTPIKHVIEIMLENHTFDNLFGAFPGANGIPANASFLNPNAFYDSAPNVAPVWASANEGDVQGGINNSRAGEQMAMDYQPHTGYAMDHYTVFPQDGMSSVTEFAPSFDPNLQYLASHYELSDRNFQPAISPTQPNVMYALNATAHDWMYNNLNPADTQPWNSIFDELAAHNRTGKVYYALPPSILNGTIWDKIVPPDLTDLSTADQFYTDLRQGALPDFSFVRPGVGYSEEPAEDIAEGDAWLGQLINAVATSKYWDSTAIFVTYDEGGGFWDHVAPPTITPYGYGSRTPTVIVSPYARAGVFHQQTTNISILSFMQHLWNLPPLNPLNARQNDLFSAFDFGQAPAPAPTLPVDPADTIAFHGTGGDLTDLPAPGVNASLTVNLAAEGGGLNLDPNATGPVTLTLTPPAGVAAPAGFPGTVALTGGRGTFTVRFPTAGYYRIAATGPGRSQGWTTVDVGVTPNTLPTP